MTALLTIENIHVRFGTAAHPIHALQDVSFAINAGETLAIVGESGSGKSTTAKAITGLVSPTAGRVLFRGAPITRKPGPDGIQMIFQDPIGSLNPHRRVRDVVAEPLVLRGVPLRRARALAAQALADVGLDPESFGERRPRQLSGGQAQRVAIARALSAEPALLVADEPVSGLDVSVQAGIINLLHRATRERDMAMLFVSHDLSVVRTLCDRVLVLYRGQTCEQGECSQVLDDPQHPYTRSLIASVPEPGKSLGRV